MKPVPLKDAIIDYVDERNLANAFGANNAVKGRVDSKPTYAGISNMKQFNDHIAAQGAHINGEKAKAILTEIIKANPNFDFSTK